jgi:plasmid maintenance system antidote protein VapI
MSITLCAGNLHAGDCSKAERDENTCRLSKVVDVKQVTISAFLRGEGISLATAQKLADHFGLMLDEAKKRNK